MKTGDDETLSIGCIAPPNRQLSAIETKDPISQFKIKQSCPQYEYLFILELFI